MRFLVGMRLSYKKNSDHANVNHCINSDRKFQIGSNYISGFEHKKTPENQGFPGLCKPFDTV